MFASMVFSFNFTSTAPHHFPGSCFIRWSKEIIMLCNNINSHFIPDIAGVNTPSPIAMQVPRNTKISSPLRNLGCFSKKDLRTELCRVSIVSSVAYADNFSSVACWFGRMLSLACRQRREYNAKVPPAP